MQNLLRCAHLTPLTVQVTYSCTLVCVHARTYGRTKACTHNSPCLQIFSCRGQSVLVVCSESAVQFTKDAAARYSSAATAAAMQYHGIAYQYNYTTQQQHNGSTTKSSGMMKIMMKFTGELQAQRAAFAACAASTP